MFSTAQLSENNFSIFQFLFCSSISFLVYTCLCCAFVLILFFLSYVSRDSISFRAKYFCNNTQYFPFTYGKELYFFVVEFVLIFFCCDVLFLFDLMWIFIARLLDLIFTLNIIILTEHRHNVLIKLNEMLNDWNFTQLFSSVISLCL